MFRRWRNRVTPLDWLCAAASLAVIGYVVYPGPRVRRSRHRPRSARFLRRRRFDPAAARGDAALQRLDHAGGVAAVHRLRLVRQASAAALDAPRLFHRAPRRPSLHDARGHLRRHGRRVIEPHHPVHDLRRHPAVFRRRQILHRLLVRGHGRASQRGGPRRRAVLLPARRPVRLRRGHDGHDRHRRLSVAGEGGLREERRGRAAGGRRARCHHLAARARRGRIPDRRVPQDLLPRRDLDGGAADHPLLLLDPDHGRARRRQVRRRRRAARAEGRAVAHHAHLLVPLRLADLDHRA